MPMRNDPASAALIPDSPPTHDRMHTDVGGFGESLKAVEFLDDCVCRFASHKQYVRYSYKERKPQCTKILTEIGKSLCEKHKMIEAGKFEDLFVEWIRASFDKKRGLTQAGLATHLGIAHPQITQLLNGKRSLKIREVPKIAEYFGAEPPFMAPLDEDFERFMEKYRAAEIRDKARALRQAMVALSEDP